MKEIKKEKEKLREMRWKRTRKRKILERNLVLWEIGKAQGRVTWRRKILDWDGVKQKDTKTGYEREWEERKRDEWEKETKER